ncbi:hypothetical protein SEUCBS139899_009795 [Sporothrix eucalyptigena]
MAQISVKFVGRRKINWDPVAVPTDAPATAPTVGPRFVATVQDMFDDVDTHLCRQSNEPSTGSRSLPYRAFDPGAHTIGRQESNLKTILADTPDPDDDGEGATLNEAPG